MRGHKQMILKLVCDKDKSLLYSSARYIRARSWMIKIGSKTETFLGPTKSLGTASAVESTPLNVLEKPKIHLSVPTHRVNTTTEVKVLMSVCV